MHRKQLLKIAASVVAFTVAISGGSVHADPISVFSGYDPGSTSLAASPNATAAAAAFDLASGPLSLIDFESPLPAGVIASGGILGDASLVCATAALHCYATSPINVYRNNGATFTFATPIDSFGAYWTGWQISGQTLTIGYLDGTTEILDMPAGDFAGGTLFFGFTHVGSAIVSLNYVAGSPGSDAVGIDDVRFGDAGPAAVPEPSLLAMLGVGLTAVSMWSGKRRRR